MRPRVLGSFFSRVTGESSASSSLPAAAPESDPGLVAAPVVTKESDREVCDDVICVAQRLIVEVRKAAAADGRITPPYQAGKEKLPRRSYFKVPSSDTSGDEVLRKRHCGQAGAHPVTLPLMRPVSPSLHSHAGYIGPSGTSRAGASSGRTTETEAAWNQVRELRSLVKEQQNVIRQMQKATVDCTPLNVHLRSSS